MLRTLAKPFNLLGAELANRLGRAADDHRTVRKLLALGDQRASPHQAVLANARPIEHHRTDADQRLVADGAAVQHDLMAHRHVAPHHQRLASCPTLTRPITWALSAIQADSATSGVTPSSSYTAIHCLQWVHLGPLCRPSRAGHAQPRSLEL